jgi:hypothetical protein
MKHFTTPGLSVITLLLTLLLLLVLSGCAAIMPLPERTYETRAAQTAELGWLALHAVDTAQTVTIARSPGCLREANPIASAIYGTDHPSPERVMLTNVALGWVHYELGGWLDRNTQRAFAEESGARGGWYVARGAFYVVSFLGTGSAVGGNYSMGIKPFSRMECER